MKKMRTMITLILAVIFVGSSAAVLMQLRSFQDGQETYRAAAEAAGLSQPQYEIHPSETRGVQPESAPSLPKENTAPTHASLPEETEPPAEEAPDPRPEDPNAEYLAQLDLSAMRKTNPDVLGWILIPDTVVSYPLVQGEDNEHYLSYTWDGKKSKLGSIELECTNSSDLSDFHTIIYGHNLENGQMFSDLPQYQEQDYYETHPYIYIANESGIYRYEIFSFYETTVTDITYLLRFDDEDQQQEFLDYCIGQSAIDTGIEPAPEDQILTLSTCTNVDRSARWVLQARLEGSVIPGETND